MVYVFSVDVERRSFDDSLDVTPMVAVLLLAAYGVNKPELSVVMY
jgi:hypothetical protein